MNLLPKWLREALVNPPPEEPAPQLTTSVEVDVHTVLYCPRCNMCMVRADLSAEGHCGRCAWPVKDVTNSPLGKAWRNIVAPRPRRVT